MSSEIKSIYCIDAHVHYYPCYSLKQWLDAAFSNIYAHDQLFLGDVGIHRILLFTERRDCHYFKKFIAGEMRTEEHGYEVKALDNGQAASLTHDSGRVLYLIGGRQIVTAERLEVLSLGADIGINDGKPLKEVIAAIQAAAGIPCLCWAPGKWLFKRGALIKNTIESRKPKELVFGDTSLRPNLFPLPSALKLAETKGFNLVAGTDPLPFPGEEKRAGSYGVWYRCQESRFSLAATLRCLSEHPSGFFGKRSGVLTTAYRLWKNQAVR